jgi:hypothetical protein
LLPAGLLDPASVEETQSEPLSQMEMTALIELMMSKFLPCFFRLSSPNSSPEDKAMIDEIRQDWLSALDSSLPGLFVFFVVYNSAASLVPLIFILFVKF